MSSVRGPAVCRLRDRQNNYMVAFISAVASNIPENMDVGINRHLYAVPDMSRQLEPRGDLRRQ